jgi:hypothetical protein
MIGAQRREGPAWQELSRAPGAPDSSSGAPQRTLTGVRLLIVALTAYLVVGAVAVILVRQRRPPRAEEAEASAAAAAVV